MNSDTLRTARRIFASIALVACLLIPTTLYAEGDPTGNWKIEIDMAGTPVQADLIVSANDDGTLTGNLKSAMGDAELSDVTFEGDTLAFTQTFGEGDAALTFSFEGTLDGDTFEGILSSDMGEMAVKGARGGANNPIGDWDVSIDMAGTPVAASLSVSANDDGTLTGNLKSAMGDAELSNVTYEGDKLAFTQTFGEGDAALTFAFEGTISGDTFEGTLSSDMGEMAVTGSRSVGSIVGEWTFTSDSQLGVITMPFIVNEDMSATYSEYDIEDLVQDGKNITFAVTVSVDGNDLPLTFEGIISSSDLIEGAYLMDGSEVATVEIVRGAPEATE
ncbi:MAG: hypothetical protein VCD00_10225 [Candidatus Hydrogenedentota bacterium]